MFSNCISLSSFPNISKWDINHVTNMNSLFSFCSFLTSPPDISKRNRIPFVLFQKHLEKNLI